MAENSENDPSTGKSLVRTWDDETAQKNSYHYDNTPIREHENVVWYELGGAARAFLLQTLARKQNNQNNLSRLPQENTDFIEVSTRQERIANGNLLGINFLVVRNDIKNGRSAHRPQIYPTPFEDENNIFYMMCPIGDGRKDGRTQFVPENSKNLTQEKSEKLSALLSPNQIGWFPIIRYPPILLQEDIEYFQPNNLE